MIRPWIQLLPFCVVVWLMKCMGDSPFRITKKHWLVTNKAWQERCSRLIELHSQIAMLERAIVDKVITTKITHCLVCKCGIPDDDFTRLQCKKANRDIYAFGSEEDESPHYIPDWCPLWHAQGCPEEEG